MLVHTSSTSEPTPEPSSCVAHNAISECSTDSEQCTRTYEWVKVIDWFENEHCSCNATCQLYGDCCNGVGDPNVTPLERGTFECSPYNVDGIYPVPTVMMNKCPEHWEEPTTRDHCENQLTDDIFIRWPVSDDRNIMYKNSYCAFCNGVSNVHYFKSHIRCNERVDLQQANVESFPRKLRTYINEDTCRIFFTPTDMAAIHYCKIHVDTCAPDWETDPDSECIRQRCQTSSDVRYVYSGDGQTIYKNMACAQCNRDEDISCNDTLSIHLYPQAKVLEFGTVNEMFYPLNIVFDLNMGTETLEMMVGHGSQLGFNTTVTATRTCPQLHVYDPYINECRQLACSKGYTYVNNVCQGQDSSTKTEQDDLCSTVITLSVEEYVVHGNGSLEELASGKEHPKGIYNIDGTLRTATVCTDLSQNFTYNETRTEYIQMFRFSAVQTWISVIGQLLSIIALIIHLIVYTILPQLRNLPGWNLMALSGSLLVSQLLFLVGTGRTEVHGLCEMFAIIMHFSFLAAFFWMNVMSFDLWVTFSKNTLASFRDSAKKCFILYSLYSWLSPGVIVLISIINYKSLDLSSHYNPAYAQGLCWITHRPALIIYFGLPLALLLLANLCFYILTVCNIRSVSESTRIVRRDEGDSGHLLVYTKLCVIMGLTWMFGFIATLAQVEPLWYIFLIFNSLQGVFICITFICTRKVYRLLREKFCKPRNRSIYEDTTKSTYMSKLRLSMSSDPGAKINLSPVLQRASYENK